MSLNLVGAASGHGGYCPEGIPVETAILGLLAAIGVAFGILYRAVTLKIAGRRKKRKAVEPMHYLGKLQDFIWIGKILICFNFEAVLINNRYFNHSDLEFIYGPTDSFMV